MVDSGVCSFTQQIPEAAQCWYKMFPNQSEEMLFMLQSLSGIESLALVDMNGQVINDQVLQAHYDANYEFFQQSKYDISDEVLTCFVDMYANVQNHVCA